MAAVDTFAHAQTVLDCLFVSLRSELDSVDPSYRLSTTQGSCQKHLAGLQSKVLSGVIK